jgi:ElaB/YqjD/DUF883 family membrane-anchored ribosome-binding protein
MDQVLDSGTDSAPDRLREQFTALNQDLRKVGHLTKEVAQEYVQAGRQKIGDAGAHVEAYVRAKPVRALGIAAAAGILLGYVLARRR